MQGTLQLSLKEKIDDRDKTNIFLHLHIDLKEKN